MPRDVTDHLSQQAVTIIACGALARELVALRKLNHWQHMTIDCVPARYHATPQLIAGAVREKILSIRVHSQEKILVAYGDCGTGGQLDKVLQETGTKRLPGAHCYEFFAGSDVFTRMHDADPGTFYLTDFLAEHFETYVWKMLGLDSKPELLPLYFGNYHLVIFLAQTNNKALTRKAKKCADRLGLTFERHFTGYGDLGSEINNFIRNDIAIVAQ